MIKETAKSMIFSTLKIVSILLNNSGVPILCYHSIQNKEDDGLFMPGKRFEEQMKYLHDKRFKTLTVSEFIELRNEKKLPKKAVVITFDDGYKDFYINAFPILKKYKFKSTIFITTNYVGRTSDWIYSEYKIKMLSWNDLKELSKKRIEIGAHTNSHIHMNKIKLEDSINEALKSKKIIESRLGKKVKTFSYPYGDYNKEISDKLKKYFDCALTLKLRKASRTKKEFNLPRIIITEYNLAAFKIILSGGFYFYRLFKK
jgi:peptidoglycan/xylan/chitin deacetylase (PgdA/CDA1 family)